ncbi:MAG: LolA family protein [Bacteroidales bacterium]
MKKSILALIGLIAFTGIHAQSLEEIVRKQSQALKEENYENVKTLKITGKMNQMGMIIGVTTYFKYPDKSRVVISFNGQEVVQFYDGNKGYLINPMSGNEPQELSADQAANMKNNSSFRSPLSRYLKENKLTLEGSEAVNDKPAFKIKAVDGSNTMYFFIDKSSWLPVKMTVIQNGISIDTFQEWSDVDGIILPKVSTTKSGNIEIIINIEKAEVNIPLDDSLFKI